MRLSVLSVLLAMTALPAMAQPAPEAPATPAPMPAPRAAPADPSRDAIADILDRRVPLSKDEDEPDIAGQPKTGPDPEPPLPPPSATAPPSYAAGPRSQLGAPVHIDEIGKTPDAPPGVRDLAYDARIRASFASAESFQGPLDGGWVLSAKGQDIYALQLVDRRDRLEGVWRDMRRKGSLNASGLVDDMQRQGAEVVLKFMPTPGAPATVATIHDAGGGQWTGELAEGDARRAVTLRRTGP